MRYTIGFLSLLLIGCFASKNDNNLPRFKSNRFSIQPNKNSDVFNYIDTSSFYMLIEKEGKNYFVDNKLDTFLYKELKSGYKFYADGKVGLFRDVNTSQVSTLDPKKATMGFYNYNKNNFFIETILYHIQSGYFLSKDKLLESKGDTLVVYSVKSPQGGGIMKSI